MIRSSIMFNDQRRSDVNASQEKPSINYGGLRYVEDKAGNESSFERTETLPKSVTRYKEM